WGGGGGAPGAEAPVPPGRAGRYRAAAAGVPGRLPSRPQRGRDRHGGRLHRRPARSPGPRAGRRRADGAGRSGGGAAHQPPPRGRVGGPGRRRPRALVVGALMAPVVAAGVLITSRRLGGDSAAETVAYLALVLGALAAGDAVRGRQELVRVLAAEADRERAALPQHRFDEQRLRYAHELHDVVGHALVAINVRAAAAAHLARREQGAGPVTALEEIASTSAEALGELRTALKGLRSDESDGVPLRPAKAGLADLGDLIAGVKGAGLTVELDMAADTAAATAHIGPPRA